MTGFRLRPLSVAVVASLSLGLGACSTNLFGPSGSPTVEDVPPLPAPEIPASIRAEEVVGRWGLAAFHKPEDRPRIEAAAKNQCGPKAYVINRGPSGGVMMHLADQTQATELRLKGGPGGKNYIGPPGASGLPEDREIVSFNGRVMIARFVDPDVAGRFGTQVYVRCAARA
jgi:hypothetical protein